MRTKSERIKIQADKLREAFKERVKPAFNKWIHENNIKDLPSVTFTAMAKVLVEQEEFIQREELVADMLRFYMVNPLDFKCIVSEPLRKSANFNEKKADYLWESMNDIAIAIELGTVYTVPNGLFSAWHPGKHKNHRALTVKEAAKICGAYFDGAI
jgi:hypothetical protein